MRKGNVIDDAEKIRENICIMDVPYEAEADVYDRAEKYKDIEGIADIFSFAVVLRNMCTGRYGISSRLYITQKVRDIITDPNTDKYFDTPALRDILHSLRGEKEREIQAEVFENSLTIFVPFGMEEKYIQYFAQVNGNLAKRFERQCDDDKFSENKIRSIGAPLFLNPYKDRTRVCLQYHTNEQSSIDKIIEIISGNECDADISR